MYIAESHPDELVPVLEAGKLGGRYYKCDNDRLTVYIPKGIESAGLCQFLSGHGIKFEFISGEHYGFSYVNIYDHIKVEAENAQQANDLLEAHYS